MFFTETYPSTPPSEPEWKPIAEAKRASLAELIPPAWRLPDGVLPPADALRDVTAFPNQFLSPREVEITERDATTLLGLLAKGEYTAVEVTNAFCHRAAIAHQTVFPFHPFLDTVAHHSFIRR